MTILIEEPIHEAFTPRPNGNNNKPLSSFHSSIPASSSWPPTHNNNSGVLHSGWLAGLPVCLPAHPRAWAAERDRQEAKSMFGPRFAYEHDDP